MVITPYIDVVNLAEKYYGVDVAYPAIIEATKDPNDPKTIFFNFSGHGLLDLSSYDNFYAGNLHNYDYPEEAIAEATKNLPKV